MTFIGITLAPTRYAQSIWDIWSSRSFRCWIASWPPSSTHRPISVATPRASTCSSSHNQHKTHRHFWRRRSSTSFCPSLMTRLCIKSKAMPPQGKTLAPPLCWVFAKAGINSCDKKLALLQSPISTLFPVHCWRLWHRLWKKRYKILYVQGDVKGLLRSCREFGLGVKQDAKWVAGDCIGVEKITQKFKTWSLPFKEFRKITTTHSCASSHFCIIQTNWKNGIITNCNSTCYHYDLIILAVAVRHQERKFKHCLDAFKALSIRKMFRKAWCNRMSNHAILFHGCGFCIAHDGNV